MLDLSNPIPLTIIIISILIVAITVIVGLVIIEYYKRKQKKD